MAKNEIKNKLKQTKRVGRRLNITISAVVIITIALFESLTFLNIHKYEHNPGEYIGIHILHLVITIGILLGVTYYLVSKYVVKPVYKLLIAIEEMKAGKMVTALEIKSNDEFELLAEEFNEMGFNLREQVQQKVRTEKYSTAIAVAKRVANTVSEPCTSLRTNAKLLKEIAKDNPQVTGLADIILKDISTIEDRLKEISTIEIPEELKSE